jgi:hypothetical protein
LAEAAGFCATQWNDWTLGPGLARGRVTELGDVPGIPKRAVERALGMVMPSVNGGVWAARADSPVLPLWHEWTVAAKGRFIADEKVLHLMVERFAPQGMLRVALGGRWNCSPKFQPKGLADADVVIRHYHGDSNVKRFRGRDGQVAWKSKRGYDLWWPLFKRCLAENIGGMAEWVLEVGNKHIDSLLKEEQQNG